MEYSQYLSPHHRHSCAYDVCNIHRETGAWELETFISDRTSEVYLNPSEPEFLNLKKKWE